MTGPQSIWHYGEIITLSDVGPIDHPSQPHPHPSVCEIPDCWVLACQAWEWSEHLQAVAE